MVVERLHDGHQRAAIVAELAELIASGKSESSSVRLLSSQRGVSPSTIWRWAKACSGKPREQWAEVLFPKQMLKQRAAEGVRQKMWTTMRVLRGFTVRRIQAAVGPAAKTSHVHKYVGCLTATGYLREGHAIDNGRHVKGWTLIRDSGPRAPVLRRNREVYDPNLNVAFAEVNDAAC